MIKAFKFRLLPTEEQQVLLAKHFGCTRFVYNHFLHARKHAWESEKKSISYKQTSKFITELKSQEKYEWLNEINSQSIQSSLRNLDVAYQKFFKTKLGYPQFKNKFDKQSFTCPQQNYINFKNETISIMKFREGIKFIKHREFKGKIKSCTISKTKTGKYFVSILVDDSRELPSKPEPIESSAIGIDLGLIDFCTLSTGEKIKNPKHLKKSQKALKRAQRKLSKKKKDSKNRDKQRIRLAVIHEKIANQRKDFHHQLSSKFIRENQTICLETLNIKGMTKNHRLSRSIGDAGWFQFVSFLKYKADWIGKNIIQIGQYCPSSKLCSCGLKNNDLKLSDRQWTCSCGQTHDRDVLAAQNIKRFAFNPALQLQSTVGTTGINACGDQVKDLEQSKKIAGRRSKKRAAVKSL